MSTQTLDGNDHVLKAKPADTGFLKTLKAFFDAIGDGARAADAYRHLTHNGVSHQDAVRKILVEDYRRA
ncbi:MAG TPA: hypothetical protein PK970_09080 [Hyphomicrobiaceae bacterium]|nr:hypothetical protein [Hyphomicrobiaceae bacterium]